MAGYTGAAGTNQGSWNGNGGGTGLTTGNTIYGNTAYGPAGGTATGYATRDANSLAMAGQVPTMGMYSNYNTLSGSPVMGGALSGQSVYAPNAQVGLNSLMNAYNASQNAVQSSPLNRPTVASLPPPVQQVIQQHPALAKSMLPAFFGGTPNMGYQAMYKSPASGTNWPGQATMPQMSIQPTSGVAPGKTDFQGSNFNGTRAAYR